MLKQQVHSSGQVKAPRRETMDFVRAMNKADFEGLGPRSDPVIWQAVDRFLNRPLPESRLDYARRLLASKAAIVKCGRNASTLLLLHEHDGNY